MIRLIKQYIHYIAEKIIDLYGWFSGILGLSPLVVRLRITNRCNLHCDFCFLKDSLNQKEEEHLNLDEWDKILSNLPAWTIFDITGAEPFLTKDFDKIVPKILSKGFKTSLITNGLKWNVNQIESLVTHGLSYFMVSIDGLEKSHNEIRGNEKSFSRIIELLICIKRIKKDNNLSYPLVSVKSTYLGNNSEELIELNNLLFKEELIDMHTINLLFQNSARDQVTEYLELDDLEKSDGNTYRYADPEKAFKGAKKILSEGYNIVFKPSVDNLEKYFTEPERVNVKNCQKYKSVITLHHDGSLKTCDIGYNVGNVKDIDYNLKKIWSLSKFENFVSHFSKINNKAVCQSCCLGKQTYE